MKKYTFMVLFALVTTASFAQDGKTTLGFTGGFGLNSTISATYGGWIDYGKWGGSITKGVTTSNEDPTNYIYGNASKYTAGSTFMNIGVHRYGLFKDENISIGGGIQMITDITTNGFEKGSTLPYVNVGYKKEIGFGTIRFDGLLGKIPTIGLGWGFTF
jgi:hypothetical protein